MILAGIDIGTNTLRLLIAEVSRDSFREIHADRRITRLGRGMDRSGILARDSVERSLTVLSEFRESIVLYRAVRTATVGTSALRNASNSTEFIADVKRETGLDISVINGKEEARLMLLGVARSLQGVRGNGKSSLDNALIIDIGGGSTEIIITHPGGQTVIASLALGAVYLTERYIVADPPSTHELALLRSAIRDELDKHACDLRPDPAGVFVGTAGTITTLAAVHHKLETYDPERINGTLLGRATIDNIVNTLCRMSLRERRSVKGLEHGREDIILAGAIITQEIMKWCGYASLLVSEWGLREGIVLDLYEKCANGS